MCLKLIQMLNVKAQMTKPNTNNHETTKIRNHEIGKAFWTQINRIYKIYLNVKKRLFNIQGDGLKRIMNSFIFFLRPSPFVQDTSILNSRDAGMLNNLTGPRTRY